MNRRSEFNAHRGLLDTNNRKADGEFVRWKAKRAEAYAKAEREKRERDELLRTLGIDP